MNSLVTMENTSYTGIAWHKKTCGNWKGGWSFIAVKGKQD